MKIGDITFVDDILITSESNKQHLKHLEGLLERLSESGITLNLEEAHFFKKEAKFLGFILTTLGIGPDLEKLKAIQDFPVSRNIKQLRGFLGLINRASRK